MFETVRSKLGPVTGLVNNAAGEGSHRMLLSRFHRISENLRRLARPATYVVTRSRRVG